MNESEVIKNTSLMFPPPNKYFNLNLTFISNEALLENQLLFGNRILYICHLNNYAVTAILEHETLRVRLDLMS